MERGLPLIKNEEKRDKTRVTYIRFRCGKQEANRKRKEGPSHLELESIYKKKGEYSSIKPAQRLRTLIPSGVKIGGKVVEDGQKQSEPSRIQGKGKEKVPIRGF